MKNSSLIAYSNKKKYLMKVNKYVRVMFNKIQCKHIPKFFKIKIRNKKINICKMNNNKI